jgi:hypothetical protein
MRDNRPWTQGEEDELKAAIDGGEGAMEIADKLERTLGSVLAKMGDLGLRIRRTKKPSKAQKLLSRY